MTVTTMTVAAKKAKQQAQKAKATNTVAQPEVVEEATSPIAKRSITCFLVVNEGEEVSETVNSPDGDPVDQVDGHFLKGTFTMSTSDLEFSWFWNTAKFDRPCLAIAKSDKFQRGLKTAVAKRLYASWRRLMKAKGDVDGIEVGQLYRVVLLEVDQFQNSETV